MNSLAPEQVVAALCELADTVADRHFNYMHPADCFCGKKGLSRYPDLYRFSPEVLEFIRRAVIEKLDREGVAPGMSRQLGLEVTP